MPFMISSISCFEKFGYKCLKGFWLNSNLLFYFINFKLHFFAKIKDYPRNVKKKIRCKKKLVICDKEIKIRHIELKKGFCEIKI